VVERHPYKQKLHKHAARQGARDLRSAVRLCDGLKKRGTAKHTSRRNDALRSSRHVRRRMVHCESYSADRAQNPLQAMVGLLKALRLTVPSNRRAHCPRLQQQRKARGGASAFHWVVASIDKSARCSRRLQESSTLFGMKWRIDGFGLYCCRAEHGSNQRCPKNAR